MAEDDTQVPDSLLPYDSWTQEALLHVVIRAIGHAAQSGLPGGHHFYITFKTAYPGVVIPDRLRAQYPDEMTIVLQHQFSNLVMDEHSKVMSVGLSFSGIPSTLVIPAAAITAFADPQVRFGLSFDVQMPVPLPAPEGDDPPGVATPGGDAPRVDAPRVETPAEVVSLDAFRRRPRE
jgi:hypothetical protein